MSWSLIHADVLEGLASLRDGSVHAAVTSPPYWGLRDYHGVPETDWPSGWRGKLGLEPTPELYVEHLVEIFREVRRVLREDGTLWLNLGSTYASSKRRSSRSLQPLNAAEDDSDDTELQGFLVSGRACPCCGGVLQVGSPSHLHHTGYNDRPGEQSEPQPEPKVRGSARSYCSSRLPSSGGAPESTNPSWFENAGGASCHEATASAYQQGLSTFRADDPRFSSMEQRNPDTPSPPLSSASRIPGRVLFCKACRYFTNAPPEHQSGDLLGVPWRVAFALQEDGWVLRSTIIWHKPCPMPESLTGWRWERCRVKTVPATYSDRDPTGGLDDPIKQQGANGIGDPTNNAQWADCPGCPKCEPDSCPCPLCREQDVQKSRGLIVKALGRTAVAAELCARAIAYQFGGAAECPICGGSGSYGGLVLRRGRWRPTTAHEYVFLLAPGRASYFADGEAVREDASAEGDTRHLRTDTSKTNGGPRDDHGSRHNTGRPTSGRNPRSVWTIGPEPYSGEHYAAFPTELPRRCIRAATPQAACAECGAPRAPVVELTGAINRREPAHVPGNSETKTDSTGWRPTRGGCTGYRPTCRCEAESTPALVLDPFAGTGTTGVAALQLGRRFVGIELSAQYLGLARERLGAACVETILQRPARVRVPEGPLFDNQRR